uniref:uncharacterized protein LOC124050313 isoform X2 n=1 Tax=Scatophagus argus TaxID=75038 RepID=UPI001ED837C8|nr:uncharacterized protein LOC124050313 isoform X2 [Scatophagus argus]
MDAQMRLFFLFIVIVSSDAEEVQKNLTATEGGSITLPDPVVEHGFLSIGGKVVAVVNRRTFQTFEEVHKDKFFWNNNTGLFTITGLQRSDSGIYHIDSKTGRVFIRSYRLIVYEPVSTPAVRPLNVSAGSCTLLCFVEEAKETTLLWYRDDDVVKKSSFALPLPLTVHQQNFSSSYRCVAVNPAEQKTLPVSFVTSCPGLNQKDNNNRSYWRVGISVSISLIVILVACIFMWMWKWKWYDKNKRTTSQTQDSLLSVDEKRAQSRDDHGNNHSPQTHTSEDNNKQGGCFPDSTGPAGSADKSGLTTVYDKLEAHRIVSTDTPDIC